MEPVTPKVDAARLLDEWLAAHERKELLRFLTCGNVDDGKSTLIGRLLLETESVPLDVLAAVEKDSRARGSQGEKTDLAFLTDGLKAEREQGITIDVAYRTFTTEKRRFILADTPGHEQYTRNMATGASTADLAILVVDARNGVTTQTRRHTTITSLLGIRQVIVAVNKMDLVDFDREAFERVRIAFEAFALKLPRRETSFIPIAALDGDNVTMRSQRLGWYSGPTVLELLETLPVDAALNRVDFRFPVQLALRPSGDFRGFAGTVASGAVRPGDAVVVLPAGRATQVARIVTFPTEGQSEVAEARAGDAVTLVLADQVDCARGDVIAHPDNRPTLSNRIAAQLVWMAEAPLTVGREYLLKHTTHETPATVSRVVHRLDVETLESREASELGLNEIGVVELRTARPLVFDSYGSNRATGAFIMIDRLSAETVAAGMIDASAMGHWLDPTNAHLRASMSGVTTAERTARLGQVPVTVLFTGLSGSGKTATARALERALFDLGKTCVVLDGSAMRQGLSRDIGFSAADRSENMRRSMEFARTLNQAGLIVLAAFAAPQEDMRSRCRTLIGAEQFLLVHLAAPLERCRERDPSGVYRDAAAGVLRDVMGIDVPYETPRDADLVLASDALGPDECAQRVLAALRSRGAIR